MNQMFQIEPGLFMGDCIDTCPIGINAIVAIQNDEQDQLTPDFLVCACWLPIPDSESIVPTVRWLATAVNIVELLRNDDLNVLVHCQGGRSRSGMVTIGYIMKTRKLTKAAAFALVHKSNENCNPNPGFMRLLDEYEKYIGISA